MRPQDEITRFKSPGPAPRSDRPRILLAEDDDAVRWALQALFEQSGYDVVAAPNGAELLGALFDEDQPHPDVLVLDLRMPGVSGLTILEGLRAEGWTVPVVVITAFSDPETQARIERLPSTVYLRKPLDPEALENAVHEAVRSRGDGK